MEQTLHQTDEIGNEYDCMNDIVDDDDGTKEEEREDYAGMACDYKDFKHALAVLSNLCLSRRNSAFHASVFLPRPIGWTASKNPYLETAEKMRQCMAHMKKLETLLGSDVNSSISNIPLESKGPCQNVRDAVEGFLGSGTKSPAMVDMMILDIQPSVGNVSTFSYQGFVEHLGHFKVAWKRCQCLFPGSGSVLRLRWTVRKYLEMKDEDEELLSEALGEALRQNVADGSADGEDTAAPKQETTCHALLDLLDDGL